MDLKFLLALRLMSSRLELLVVVKLERNSCLQVDRGLRFGLREEET